VAWRWRREAIVSNRRRGNGSSSVLSDGGGYSAYYYSVSNGDNLMTYYYWYFVTQPDGNDAYVDDRQTFYCVALMWLTVVMCNGYCGVNRRYDGDVVT